MTHRQHRQHQQSSKPSYKFCESPGDPYAFILTAIMSFIAILTVYALFDIYEHYTSTTASVAAVERNATAKMLEMERLCLLLNGSIQCESVLDTNSVHDYINSAAPHLSVEFVNTAANKPASLAAGATAFVYTLNPRKRAFFALDSTPLYSVDNMSIILLTNNHAYPANRILPNHIRIPSYPTDMRLTKDDPQTLKARDVVKRTVERKMIRKKLNDYLPFIPK